ncbi:hypothetical protein ACFOG5_24610 [Pedobacter fastidiosus]
MHLIFPKATVISTGAHIPNGGLLRWSSFRLERSGTEQPLKQ